MNHWITTPSLALTVAKNCQTCHIIFTLYAQNVRLQCIPRSKISMNWNNASKEWTDMNHALYWTCGWQHIANVYVLASMLDVHTSSIWSKDDVTYYTFWRFLPITFVDIEWLLNVQVLCWRLNLSLQIFQGSVSTDFRWSWYFMHSFVKCLFEDMPANFYRNQFKCDRHRAKKVGTFFETLCTSLSALLLLW